MTSCQTVFDSNFKTTDSKFFIDNKIKSIANGKQNRISMSSKKSSYKQKQKIHKRNQTTILKKVSKENYKYL